MPVNWVMVALAYLPTDTLPNCGMTIFVAVISVVMLQETVVTTELFQRLHTLLDGCNLRLGVGLLGLLVGYNLLGC